MVKLTRTVMIIPIVMGLAFLKAPQGKARRYRPAATPANSAGLPGRVRARRRPQQLWVRPQPWHATLTTLGAFLITTAMSGIGLSLRPADLRAAGHRPLLGALLWIAVATSSIGLQAVTGTL